MNKKAEVMRLSQFLEADINEHLTAIRDLVDSKESRIEKLEKENRELTAEHYKDKKLQEVSKKLKQMQEAYWRGFPISEEEKESIEDWCIKHEKERHGLDTFEQRLKAGGAIGGRYHYVFTTTSIGTSGRIVCSCGEAFEFQEIG